MIFGGQEEHRHLSTLGTQTSEHLPAVHAGQHDVQNDEVVVALQRLVQSVHTVVEQLNRVARFAQSHTQVLTRFAFVFNNQDFHVHSCGDFHCQRPIATEPDNFVMKPTGS